MESCRIYVTISCVACSLFSIVILGGIFLTLGFVEVGNDVKGFVGKNPSGTKTRKTNIKLYNEYVDAWNSEIAPKIQEATMEFIVDGKSYPLTKNTTVN